VGRRTLNDRADGRLRDADERAAEGGSDAPGRQAGAHDRERFVLDYESLACSLARKFHWCGEDVEDLQQVGGEALVVAAHRFDPGHGVRFRTCAYSPIWGRLMRHVRRPGNTWTLASTP
jgi:DNA-directed RNA polymerase specialized sigma subunit